MKIENETYNLLVNLGRADLDAHLELEMTAAGVPRHMQDGLTRYLRYGIRPGSFLVAVLENDLSGAVERGDIQNQAALASYPLFLFQMPVLCWGTREKVEAWLQAGREAAHREQAVAFVQAAITPCPACGGTRHSGTLEDETCPTCEGSGRAE